MRIREKVHAELRLPGTDRDWQFILSQEIDGRRYYKPLDSLGRAMTPPFPRTFAQVPRLREKYGIKPTWYAMFSAPSDGAVPTVSSPPSVRRKQFAENFRGLAGHLLRSR